MTKRSQPRRIECHRDVRSLCTATVKSLTRNVNDPFRPFLVLFQLRLKYSSKQTAQPRH